MKLLNTASLERGATLIDYALPANGQTYSIPDLIGIVAAFIGRGHNPLEIEKELAKRFNPRLACQAKATFQYFDRYDDTGLWTQGACAGDICFTNDTLTKLYPAVNQAQSLVISQM